MKDPSPLRLPWKMQALLVGAAKVLLRKQAWSPRPTLLKWILRHASQFTPQFLPLQLKVGEHLCPITNAAKFRKIQQKSNMMLTARWSCCN